MAGPRPGGFDDTHPLDMFQRRAPSGIAPRDTFGLASENDPD